MVVVVWREGVGVVRTVVVLKVDLVLAVCLVFV